ncbi:MAG: PAS domain S-box protein [Bdellovibrionota bacterium]
MDEQNPNQKFDLDHLPGIAALVDKDGKLIAGNPAFKKLPPDSAQLSSEKSVKAYCQRTLLEAGHRCIQKGAEESFEMGETTESGPTSWFRGLAALFTAGSPEPRAIVHCTSTLAEKLRMDSLLRTERLMTDAQGIAHLGTWEWEPKIDFVTWSDELYRIYALTPETYKPTFKAYLEKIHPEDRAHVQEAMHKALTEKTPFSHDERIFRPDGSMRYLHTWGHPVLNRDGSIARLVGVCQDITERTVATMELKESEKRYRQMVETAEEGVWLINETEMITFVNRKMAQMIGHEPSDMIGKSLYDFLDAEGRATTKKNVQRRRQGVREQHDFRLRHKDGHNVWVNMAASPTYDAGGNYSGALAMVSDVTERRQNEILLFTQRNIFELLVQGKKLPEVLDPLVLVIESFNEDVRGSILLISEDGKRVRTGSAPNLPAKFNEAIDGAAIGPKAGSCGTAAYRKELVIVEDIETDPLWEDYRELARPFGFRACWSSPIMAGEKLLGTFALYFCERRKPTERDLRLVKDFSAAAALVIKHIRMRDSLAESEARFRLLSEAASEGVAIHERGRLLVANELMGRMFGYTPAELLDMNILDLAAPDFQELLASKLLAQEDVKYQGLGRRKDGSQFWAEVKGRDAMFQGRPVRLAAIRDISEQKDLEAARERVLERERNARTQAEHTIRIRDEFLAIASHELKTPLTPLKIELQLLRRYMHEAFEVPTLKSDVLLKALDLGESELDRLGSLINDLLDVTRITAGRLELNIGPGDFAAEVRDVAERFKEQIAAAGCKLTLELPESLKGAWDMARLDQVITNLFTNAIKYGKGSPIQIKLREEDGNAVLSVEDRGIGISAADQEKIFDRFVRLAPVENYGGLGLGLFIVKRIVLAHGGSISVESEPGKGAKFTVALPLSPY